MGGYTKGSETKGGERKGNAFYHQIWVLPWGGKKNQKEEKAEVPWVLWKGGLAIGSGTAYAMAIVTSAFNNSDHSNYVLPLVP
jgi:hypothetical protein